MMMIRFGRLMAHGEPGEPDREIAIGFSGYDTHDGIAGQQRADAEILSRLEAKLRELESAQQ